MTIYSICSYRVVIQTTSQTKQKKKRMTMCLCNTAHFLTAPFKNELSAFFVGYEHLRLHKMFDGLAKCDLS